MADLNDLEWRLFSEKKITFPFLLCLRVFSLYALGSHHLRYCRLLYIEGGKWRHFVVLFLHVDMARLHARSERRVWGRFGMPRETKSDGNSTREKKI